MNQNWFIRMAQWARNPPSPRKVKLVLSVVAICFAIYMLEKAFGWPQWLSVNPQPRPKF